jgi:cellobiose phosphorylase
MILNNKIKSEQLTKGGLIINFLSSGDLFDVSYEDRQINLIKGNQVDGSLMNIYLRVFEDDMLFFTKLLGKHSPSRFELKNDQAIYTGVFRSVAYQVILTLEQLSWNFNINLRSDKNVRVDLIYGQDVAIQSKSHVLSSEPYTVQYIDYKAFEDTNGFTLCARQNQGASQFLQIGSVQKNIGYTTDGFQFFGLSYKETGIPKALLEPKLPSEIYQYEFSYFALQSDIIVINNDNKSFDFYGYYDPQFNSIIKNPVEMKKRKEDNKSQFIAIPFHQISLLNTEKQINGLDVDRKYLENKYQIIEHVEMNQEGILSFFTKRHHHVVLKRKELLVERPHGHLMIHGDLKNASENVMATTNFMFGLFNSHVVLGNTSFNKFLGDLRNPLNVQKVSGQRIYIKLENTYQLLGLPSLYEMGGTTTKWIYVLPNDTITVSSFVDIDNPVQTLLIESEKNKVYDFIVSQQILMGVNEYVDDISYERDQQTLRFIAPKNSMMYSKYPLLTYQMESSQPFEIISEKKAFGHEDQLGLLLMKYQQQSSISIVTRAAIDGSIKPVQVNTYDEADQKGTLYFESFAKNLDIKHDLLGANLKQLIHLTFWYTHNALTHYASPHGLEQYNGAAWGTRDVCQGPIEFFSAAQQFSIVRDILLKVYARQFKENGDFPQWYMFDKYYQIQAHESHGDIIIWPLRSIAYYLKATADLSILDEYASLMSLETNDFSHSIKIIDHLKLQIESIRKTFIEGTHLPRYGGGDWDDTLQPANHDLTTKMVSGWTVALLYESVKLLSEEIKSYDELFSTELISLAQLIKIDYENYLIVDGIPAGFVVIDGNDLTYLLHPRDVKTGLKYRLLPFTRGMISEIADENQIEKYAEIIKTVFKHPDGVRLMDTTVEYKGGQKTYFTRAETAANFGREIGLQYVHAHIRYIEAMAKIGYKNEAYQGLFEINPILIQKAVPNAIVRQSNVYFSSSDADFKNRYEAKEKFDLIKKGEIGVKGGWRLYSSGPGIYINQLITKILGIQVIHGDLVIDPMLPDKYDGLILTYHFQGKPLTIKLHKGSQHPLFMGKPFDYKRVEQKYRKGGIQIPKHILDQYQHIDLDIWFE